MHATRILAFGLAPSGPADGMTAHKRLLCAGGIMLVVLLWAAVFYHIPGVIGSDSEEVGSWYLVIGVLTAYFQGYKALQLSSDNSTLRKTIIGFAVAFGFLAILIPPFFSTDVYCYGNIGWQQLHYGVNPYVQSVSDVPNWQRDPMFHIEKLPSAYGFLFAEMAYAVCWLGGGNQMATALLFKLINAAVFGLTGWLIWRGCIRLRRPNPERALYLFLWNPLLLLHVLADGHNDLLMGVCTAACIFCLIGRRWLVAIPLLMAGALVKYGSVTLLPILLLYMGKRYGKSKAAIGLALGLALFAAIAAPYLVSDWRHIALGRMAGNVVACRPETLTAFLLYPYEVVAELFPALAPFAVDVATAIKLLLGIGFLAFYLRLLAVRLRGSYDAAKLLYDCLLVQFILVCFVSAKFYPWYLAAFLPLAYWLPAGDKLRGAVLAVACAQVLQFTFLRSAMGINTVILLLGPVAYALLSSPKKHPLVRHGEGRHRDGSDTGEMGNECQAVGRAGEHRSHVLGVPYR